MIKHIWSVLCQRSVVDQQSNNISLIDVFEQLQVDIPPKGISKTVSLKDMNIPIQYELVNLWSKTKEGIEEKENIRIVLYDPNGNEIKRIDKEFIIPKDKKRMREINKIQGITLRGSGVYNFVVSIKQQDNKTYKQAAKLPLEVKITKDN
jgi:hypothetical protein